jgi:hypothetical protein
VVFLIITVQRSDGEIAAASAGIIASVRCIPLTFITLIFVRADAFPEL